MRLNYPEILVIFPMLVTLNCMIITTLRRLWVIVWFSALVWLTTMLDLYFSIVIVMLCKQLLYLYVFNQIRQLIQVQSARSLHQPWGAVILLLVLLKVSLPALALSMGRLNLLPRLNLLSLPSRIWVIVLIALIKALNWVSCVSRNGVHLIQINNRHSICIAVLLLFKINNLLNKLSLFAWTSWWWGKFLVSYQALLASSLPISWKLIARKAINAFMLSWHTDLLGLSQWYRSHICESFVKILNLIEVSLVFGWRCWSWVCFLILEFHSEFLRR